jgi:hypothetical protein
MRAQDISRLFAQEKHQSLTTKHHTHKDRGGSPFVTGTRP